MFVFAFWAFVAAVVVLKVVDWKGAKWFDDVTYVRTRLFGLSVLLAVATLALFGLEWVVPMMFGPRM